ncbi:hypothetical protein SISSUDRAFT_919887 [Sistotremastrum suecicum HHB10207 ss-3]|uniref:Uncharacterized protein n=1 Tax=Sistotremastrum suecicum HHB10207 ss-3 TaxID=1314776 RepID=A0A166BVZ1_9AGAM|nr:hypothetical protein SISSUDRAFT_919887 [Sistotremastrum suecicum HHB10207 ss-3]
MQGNEASGHNGRYTRSADILNPPVNLRVRWARLQNTIMSVNSQSCAEHRIYGHSIHKQLADPPFHVHTHRRLYSGYRNAHGFFHACFNFHLLHHRSHTCGPPGHIGPV